MSIVSVREGLRTNVLIIGAGQAGLAAAHALEAAGVEFIIVDALPAVGDSWRNRYESLTLFTPRNISALPGMPLVGDPDGYATKAEFADYLGRYAVRNRYEVITSTRIARLRKVGSIFEAFSEGGLGITSKAVIIATGAFQTPRIPDLSRSFPPQVQQMHVADFRDERSINEGPVLVVGDGASGRDVALSLAASHSVLLARGRRRTLLAERVFGRSVWWWLQRLGFLRATADSFVGRRMRKVDPFPKRGNDDTALVRAGVVLKPRLVAVGGGSSTFADGSSEIPRAVIWATGYADDFRWIDIK
ncbi:NAD(P)/FAD-dependent oxidoreductase [Rhizobium sp. LC145]|uniref:NAD(P)-binding domain-containing protein n=1 Tax=Rhizobium sp. LC145 TaxID=1120688 RepID=UPI000B0460D6|nr:NAD(P)/FAD-dependent oxidoreductase [Rhizobium sp. LC145]MDX3928000.1 NAD(P)/FAD-dependent oxidoreductase [Shinella sp.]